MERCTNIRDLEEYEKAEERLREAIKGYEIEFGEEQSMLSGLEGWKYGQTPLWWAAENGHEAVVKLLLETGKVEADLKDKSRSDAALAGC
jgi:hypothetical protein